MRGAVAEDSSGEMGAGRWGGGTGSTCTGRHELQVAWWLRPAREACHHLVLIVGCLRCFASMLCAAAVVLW